MGSQVLCWICESRGERQLSLRRNHARDGRSVCRVCLRRLLQWIRQPVATGDARLLEAVWPAVSVPAEIADGEEWREDVRQAFKHQVMGALPAADDATRAAACLGFLEMGFLWDALEALATVEPAAAEADALSEGMLQSLLSRLLDPEILASSGAPPLLAVLYAPA